MAMRLFVMLGTSIPNPVRAFTRVPGPRQGRACYRRYERQIFVLIDRSPVTNWPRATREAASTLSLTNRSRHDQVS